MLHHAKHIEQPCCLYMCRNPMPRSPWWCLVLFMGILSCAELPGQICDNFVYCNKTTCQDRFPGQIPLPKPFGGCALQWQGGINGSTQPVTNYACETDYGSGEAGTSKSICGLKQNLMLELRIWINTGNGIYLAEIAEIVQCMKTCAEISNWWQ